MELIKKNIHMNRTKCKSNLQVTFDDDFNVPDSKPDINKLVTTQGEVKFTDQKISNQKLYVSGCLQFQILYLSDDPSCPVQCIQNQIAFDETVNLSDTCNQDIGNVKYEIEDITASIINSRKLNLKSLVRLTITVEDTYDEESAISIDAEDDVQCIKKNIELTSLAVNKKDNYRFRDELVIPSAKSCVAELLFYNVELKNLEIRLLADKFTANGDISVFLLYRGENEDNAIEYYDTELPFSSTIDCNGVNEDMIPYILLDIVGKNLSVKPDSDGEERVLDLEVIFELSIKVYEETQLQILKDIYSPVRNITPLFKETKYENLLIRNCHKSRVTERIQLNDTMPHILQICYCNGSVKVDEVTPVETGLEANGILDVHILYISSDDSQPIQALREQIPFTQTMDIKDFCQNCTYDIKPELEMITVNMLDTQEVEVKASIVLNSIVFCAEQESFITDYNEEPLDTKLIDAMPGMICYYVKPQDTLWSIAKRYYTTVESIMEVNELESEEIYPGQQLLIVKELELGTSRI